MAGKSKRPINYYFSRYFYYNKKEVPGLNYKMKRYSKNEPWIFLWVMIPYVIAMNLILFGSCVIRSLSQFSVAFLSSTIYLFACYFLFGVVAIQLRKKIPAAGDLFKRIGIMLPIFYGMNIGLVNGIIFLYENVHLVSCDIKRGIMWWGVLYGCIMSTGITFLNEGVANFEIWKSSLNETERLRNMYKRSKLLGLKGQINSHFLFNCFNTLSGLIDEDEEKAEKFLDEMTKVHRYLLRKEDDMFVPLADEIKFSASYLYLIKQRFGGGIEIKMDVPAISEEQLLPPLSMQVVLENIIYTNAISKNDPLRIHISVTDDLLLIRHSLHEKKIVENLGADEGLDILINKYILLKAGEVEINESEDERVIKLPLIKEMEVAL
jgi:sensor histidine kinase YesM